tara:strand:+ start:329 stop:910 length:582 start_codon:yes stop_codon:yes gene_type:complete
MLFISQKLKITQANAYKIQKKMYKTYGTTLYGLIKFYGIEPREFLDFVHDVELSKIKKCSELDNKIKNLPGEKIIFTNGDFNWAKKMLKALGLEKNFHKIFDIIKANYIPKPKKRTYLNLIRDFNILPEKAIFFEDTEKNLEPAFKLGITTVHIDENFNKKDTNKLKPFINHKFKCIKSALNNINNNTYYMDE